MTHPDPNQCPCTTGRDSFDGLTLLELGDRDPAQDLVDRIFAFECPACGYRQVSGPCRTCDPRSTSDEDGHLEVDDWYEHHSQLDASQP